jgi:hypothetical protein
LQPSRQAVEHPLPVATIEPGEVREVLGRIKRRARYFAGQQNSAALWA